MDQTFVSFCFDFNYICHYLVLQLINCQPTLAFRIGDQWRIQDFPECGASNSELANLLLKTALKPRNWTGWGCSKRPPGSVNADDMSVIMIVLVDRKLTGSRMKLVWISRIR